MKASLNSLEKDYIGNYNQEYRNVGLLKEKPFSRDWKERREKMYKEKVPINENNHFLSFVVEQVYSEDNAVINSVYATKREYKRVMNGIRGVKHIDKSAYEKIENALSKKIEGRKSKEETDFLHLKEYINEFAMIVMYAQKRCFEESEKHKDILEKVLSDSKKREIRNFYAKMTKNEVDVEVNKIIIDYSITEENKTKAKEIQIDTPILLKIMLYEFARGYYTSIEREDVETWESDIPYYYTDKVGRKALVYKYNLISLIKVFRSFVDNEKLFNVRTPMKIKDLLLGRLLSIVEPKFKFGFKETPFVYEAEYYSHEFQIILRVNQKSYQKKVSEKTKPK